MDMLQDQAALEASIERLINQDECLQSVRAVCGDIALRQRPGGLRGLLQIILAQQVSVASARAITARFEAQFPDCNPQQLLMCEEDKLRACSLSRPKIKSVKAIAQAMVDGFEFEALSLMDNDQAHEALVSLHGVGPWTAEVYLQFCMGRADIFPAGDLALQVAVQDALGLDERPKALDLSEMAQSRWAPERSAAAHLFWAYYHHLKAGRDGVV